ncbi:hypothetical protein Patl1_33303 [Pistacia atlantica]|uniref:Uncharacterized protein n=1 Tax=Pistacia atlantica TaxID=434234 RepID=A0ACC0ZRS8_9ROSI|nr:hypothetical protein Patl1_33303 [Pistacia atlantica]
MQIIYMGKSSRKDQITKNISTVTVEKLSHSIENLPQASIEALKRKNVLLLISDLEGFEEELFMLKQMYIESCQHLAMTESLYEVVWIPIMDRSTPWTQAKQHQFENHQLSMPWYSVYHPSIINSAVIMYFQEVWQFKKKPILVALDPLGKMNILDNCIYLYGGENIDWIRKFTATAHKVAEVACIRLKILYVGKNNSEKQVRKNIYTIIMEKLSHSLQEYHQVWLFWKRLGSMWHSKMQLSCMVENDPIIQEINTLLSFDKSDEGWAVFGRGSALAKAKVKPFGSA